MTFKIKCNNIVNAKKCLFICSVCNKPVDCIFFRRNIYENFTWCTLQCHGEEEIMIIPKTKLIDLSDFMRGYKVFKKNYGNILIKSKQSVTIPEKINTMRRIRM